jgi:hypothetical protein
MLFFPTADQDFQYFRSRGYTGSLNDMHYKAMGDLGYTGSLNDRIHAYLISEYGSFYEAMRDLRNGTSVFSLSYIFNGFNPALVFDFKGNYFRKSATDSTFGASITHAATTNATMVDSDGLMKWRPHNLLKNSGDMTGSGWVQQFGVTSIATGSPFGSYQSASPNSTSSTEAQSYQINKPLTQGATYVAWSLAKYSAGNGWFSISLYDTGSANNRGWFDLKNGVVGSKDTNIIDYGMIDYGDGWWFCYVSKAAASTSGGINLGVTTADGATDSNSGDVILIAGSQFNLSTLGGMVNNPDTSSSYVPTTTTNLYLSRRGHHIYSGSAWVNEGILHESEARTNLFTYSNTFTNSAWAKTNMTVTANQATGLDGVVSASKIAIGGTSSTSYCINSTASTTGTLSYFAKQNTERFFVVDRGPFSAGDYAIFDLSNGTISKSPTFSGSSAHITPMGNGWYRCVLQSAQGTSTNAFTISGSGTNLTTATSGTIYLWGAQFEVGSTPSSYIPTGSATVTRAAETLTVPAASLPYDSTNMSIQMDGKMTYADTGGDNGKLIRWEKDVNNKLWVSLDSSGASTGSLYWTQRSLGVSDFTSSLPQFSPDTNVPFNLSSRHGSTFLNGAVGGTAGIADTTPTSFPDLSASNLSLGHNLMGTIGQLLMWSDDLGDVGIAEAST